MQKRTLYEEGNFHKGNLHTHTVRSDGANTPEEVMEKYYSEGYRFLAITDHWVYGDYPQFNREDFLMFSGTELDIETPDRKDHHIVALGIPETNKITDGYTFEDEQKRNSLYTVPRIIEYFGQKGNVTIYAHPYWSKVDSGDIKNIHGLLGMEIYNHGSEFESNNGNSETYFDHFLYVRNKLYAFATDDSHELGPYSRGGYIMAKTKDFTHQGILQALLDGSFYATSGPVIHDFYVEGNKAYFNCEPCSHIYFQTPHRGKDFFSEDEMLTSGEFELDGEEEYVRVTIKDQYGRKAWTQPIWLWVH